MFQVKDLTIHLTDKKDEQIECNEVTQITGATFGPCSCLINPTAECDDSQGKDGYHHLRQQLSREIGEARPE